MPADAARAPGHDWMPHGPCALWTPLCPLIMSNQQTKSGETRSEAPAPTKLNGQDNTHSEPVRTLIPVPRTADGSRDVLL